MLKACDTDPSNDCTYDCSGVWGGEAYEDNCGNCDADPTNDCIEDCNGVWGGGAYVDGCGTCDDDPRNDCIRDCNGVWGGDAYEDNCGVCDADPTNDCFDGVTGTLTIAEFEPFDIGSGELRWTIFDHQQAGWIGSYFSDPMVTFAGLHADSDCPYATNYDSSGYNGIATVNELTDASALTYSEGDPAIIFGTRESDCYRELLVYRQGDQYGVIDFVKMENDGELLIINYWVGNPGATDFSKAPPID